jgi:hypothetical protein
MGREKDPENSEVAQLIRQSLQVCSSPAGTVSRDFTLPSLPFLFTNCHFFGRVRNLRLFLVHLPRVYPRYSWGISVVVHFPNCGQERCLFGPDSLSVDNYPVSTTVASPADTGDADQAILPAFLSRSGESN